MGHMLNKLANLPVDDNVKCYIFLISAGYDDPLNDLIEKNFPILAARIGDNAIIAKGTDAESFGESVISKYLGSSTQAYIGPIPSLLITDTHPSELHEWSLRLLVPLQEVEKRFPNGWGDFFSQLSKFARGENQNFLNQFQAAEDIDTMSTMANALISLIDIKPGIFGISLNAKKALEKIAEWRPKLA